MNRQIRTGLTIVFLVLLFVLAGCSSVPGFRIAPEKTVNETELYSDTVYIRNCADFKNEKHTPLTENAPIVANVELADQAISDSTGEKVVISQDLKEKLQKQIEKEYANILEEQEARVAEKDLVVPPYSIRVFNVLWKQMCNCSIVAFEMDKQTYTANFSYKIEYPTLQDFQTSACTA